MYIIYHIGSETFHDGYPYLNCSNGTTPSTSTNIKFESKESKSKTYPYPNMAYANVLHEARWEALLTSQFGKKKIL